MRVWTEKTLINVANNPNVGAITGRGLSCGRRWNLLRIGRAMITGIFGKTDLLYAIQEQ